MLKLGVFAALAMVAGPALAQDAMAPQAAPQGYLAGQPPLDILKILPPPPAPGSPQDIADRTIYATSAAGIDGPRWAAAVGQLSVTAPAFQQQLACALGARLSPQGTPATMALLARAGRDMVGPMNTAKMHYARPRPFTTDKGRACDPDSADGVGAALGFAYPSGHSGIGWLWALVLGDAAPQKAAAVRAFGVATGDLRVACRVHWLSDVAYGRVLATAVYERISATPAFKADLAKAQAELAKAEPLACPAG